MKYISLIWKNTFRNKRRSILTVLSIALSLCLLGLMMALYHSFYFTEPTADEALRLIARNRVSLANPLPLAYQQKIAAVPGVQEVIVLQWYGGTYKDNRDTKNMFARFAVEPEKLLKVYPEFEISDEEMKAFLSERTACVIGRKIANRHGFKLGDRIALTGDIFPDIELTIRAFYDSKINNETAFFHWAYLREVVKMDVVSTFVIRAASPEDVPRIARGVDAMFRNSPLQTKTETEQAFALSFLGFLGDVKLFIMAICGAVTFTILLVSGNTMAMSVRERVREVGVLKTLGYAPGAILGILLAESVFISLIGGVIGLAMAQGLCLLIRQAPPFVADLSQLSIQPPVLAISLGVAAIVGVVSCSLPAWGAARRPIVEALRATG